MLVLSRKPGERIRIGSDVRITLVRIGANSVRLGIEAPGQRIIREEIVPAEEAAAVVAAVAELAESSN